jgi:hypothetical protein
LNPLNLSVQVALLPNELRVRGPGRGRSRVGFFAFFFFGHYVALFLGACNQADQTLDIGMCVLITFAGGDQAVFQLRDFAILLGQLVVLLLEDLFLNNRVFQRRKLLAKDS